MKLFFFFIPCLNDYRVQNFNRWTKRTGGSFSEKKDSVSVIVSLHKGFFPKLESLKVFSKIRLKFKFLSHSRDENGFMKVSFSSGARMCFVRIVSTK